MGLRPRSVRRLTPWVTTRSGKPCTLGARRNARRHSGRAARPCAGELPVRRRSSLTSLGCEQVGHLRARPRDGKPCQKPALGEGADGATRSARRRGTATPRLRRPSGGAVRLGPRAGVRLTLGSRPPKSARRSRHGSTAGRSEPRGRRVASLRHGGASRDFPSVQHNGARRRRAPGVLAHWLGVAAARRLLCSIFHNLETTSLFARRRRRSGAQPAQEPQPSRHGNSVARRPAPRQEINSDAAPHLGSQHRKESKGEKRVEWPRCSRWGDGVVVAGLSVAWRRCFGQ
jgi:hypothetical protein